VLGERVEKLLRQNGQLRIPNWIVMVFNSGHNHKIQSWLQKLLGVHVPHGTMIGLRKYLSHNSCSSDPHQTTKSDTICMVSLCTLGKICINIMGNSGLISGILICVQG
jgi:hypothetical protein